MSISPAVTIASSGFENFSRPNSCDARLQSDYLFPPRTATSLARSSRWLASAARPPLITRSYLGARGKRGTTQIRSGVKKLASFHAGDYRKLGVLSLLRKATVFHREIVLPRGRVLPSAINPKPLVRVLTDHVFKKDVKGASVLYDVTGRVFRGHIFGKQSKRRRYLRVVASPIMKPGMSAAPLRRARAWRQRTLWLQESRRNPQKCLHHAWCSDRRRIPMSFHCCAGLSKYRGRQVSCRLAHFRRVPEYVSMSLSTLRLSPSTHDKLHRIAVKGVQLTE